MLIADAEVTGGERVKILDFGIAKVTLKEAQGAPVSASSTRSGIWMGTPGYMAPEQIYGANTVDGRADVYSLGIILYELLSGTRPVRSDSTEQELCFHMTATPPPLRERAPAIPASLAGLVHAMLAKRPEERPTMREVVGHLQAVEFSTPDSLPVGQAAPRPTTLRSIAGVGFVSVLMVSAMYVVWSFAGRPAGLRSAAGGREFAAAGLDAGLSDAAPSPTPTDGSASTGSTAAQPAALDPVRPPMPFQPIRQPHRETPAVKNPINPHDIFQLK